jgi:hypothetical protein
MLPNTFIIGAQKSGTTALHYLLSQHPDVFFPRTPQELHFFDVEENFRRGMGWYEAHFHDWSHQRVIAQTSPLYLYEPNVPARIHEVLPGARFIVVLRNPVDRAYSHYWHEVKHGFETLPFEEALIREPERLQQGFDGRRHFSYAGRGAYATQLERFLAYFPRRNLLALRFEDLAGNVDEIAERCSDFLNISKHSFSEALLAHGAKNAARMPRSRAVHKLGRALASIIPVLGHTIIRTNLKQVNYPEMRLETRRSLQSHFQDEVLRTEMITGLDLKAWLETA